MDGLVPRADFGLRLLAYDEIPSAKKDQARPQVYSMRAVSQNEGDERSASCQDAQIGEDLLRHGLRYLRNQGLHHLQP